MKKILSYLMSMLICACSANSEIKDVKITNANITAYLKTYTSLKNTSPEFLARMMQSRSDEASLKEFNVLESKISQSGVKDYQEFVKLNAKIGGVFAILKATQSMHTFETLNSDGQSQLQEGIALIQQQLEDPEIPETTKEQLRESLQALEKGKSELNAQWESNKPFAEVVIEYAEKLQGIYVTDEEVTLIKNRMKEIEEAYIGMPIPEIDRSRLLISET